MSHITIGFSRSNTIIGRVIEFITRGRWSHCMLMHPDMNRRYIESSGTEDPSGVYVREIHEYIQRGEWDFRIIPHPDPMRVWGAAFSQIGKAYDWAYIFGWFFHARNWQRRDKWVCHELIAWAAQEAGHPIIDMTDAHWLTPQHLYLISKPME